MYNSIKLETLMIVPPPKPSHVYIPLETKYRTGAWLRVEQVFEKEDRGRLP